MCRALGIPFWVGEDDVDAAENPELIRERQPDNWLANLMIRIFGGPGHPVDRALREGDEVAGFQVIHVPGHSAGHIAFWRESDRVLIAGDVVNTHHPFTLLRGVREPLDAFTPDPAQNRRSIKRIAALEPELLLVGHGPPVRGGRQLQELAARLPA